MCPTIHLLPTAAACCDRPALEKQDVESISKLLQQEPDLQAVTEEQVMEAAGRIFDRRRAVTGWIQKPADAEESK